MEHTKTAQQLVAQLEQHQMVIEQDNGVFRSIRFAAPNTNVQSYRLTTWPGYIAISGDMGTYVFARMHDMFEFFRQPGDGPIDLSLGYWAEKCVSADPHSGIQRYSPDKFEDVVMDIARNPPEELDDPEGLIREVREEVLPFSDDGERMARYAAERFEYEGKGVFLDFWEVNLREYTSTFVEACTAIVQGIRQYDGIHQWTAVATGEFDTLYVCKHCKARHVEAADQPGSEPPQKGCSSGAKLEQWNADAFHDHVVAIGYGEPTEAGRALGEKLVLAGDDCATAAHEVVARGLTTEPEETDQ
ncbi:hypothetical protein [Thioalkalivibrio sp. ALE16]|uniref:hypothetical protein n=1 Tax=Thioalkalivibrio sp. ALE16 TaxID=1158172 RepID=UPI000360452E|nr:hypothetical protein [Thioalkalivibrio sp. ALE16]